MCGLTGFLGGVAQNGAAANEALLRRMTDTIVNRGPDDAGAWYDVEQRIGLGFRRLSILDISPAGHQPMKSSSGRFVIMFNGEIYNHKSLRQELESGGAAPTWCGHSDTETLLAGFDAWGIQETVKRTTGMFAIAVWDRRDRTLTLVRDRIGEKPLYYGWQRDTFLFGSELKALRVHPDFMGEIDRGSLSLLMRFNYIPAPCSIYQGISKLMPGCLLAVSLRQREPQICTYWSGIQAVESGVANSLTDNGDRTVDDLESLLQDAVGKEMVADVPLGAFLSGGVDSSTIVALMQAQSSRPVKTFCIGFHEARYNEAEYAKAVARHLHTDHTELYVTAEQAASVIPLLPNLYDEPFSDSSQIPTFLISQLARQHVTVSLSGDGGDELFCGYERYRLTAMLWHTLAAVPMPLRHLVQQILTGVSPTVLNRMTDAIGRMLPRSVRMRNIGDMLQKGAKVLTSSSAHALYLALVSHWRDSGSPVLDGRPPVTMLTGDAPGLVGLNDVQRMMALDLLTYLPDDILVKVDRASMGVSLEVRTPFLDHRVVEFAWRMPLSMKIRKGQSKWALRQVLYKHVPRGLIERPKKGFAVPIDSWLRGPLRDWAEYLLDERRLREQGFLSPAPIRRKLKEHLIGQKNWQYSLWSVLMFQAWLQGQRP